MRLNVIDERPDAGGPAPAVVLLHGLTATHRYVVMGSSHLRRSGHRVISYDARGHGQSDPAPRPGAYTYSDLTADLFDVLDRAGVERAVLAGASMGAHTAIAAALARPAAVAGLVLITPAFLPGPPGAGAFEIWDARAEGLRRGGIDGFLAADRQPGLSPAMRATVERVIRQRLALHRDLGAVADALQAVPRSEPFSSFGELAAISVPTAVVADRDEADPGHPLAVGERYASVIPGASLHVEAEGESPLAWRGASVSRIIEQTAAPSSGARP